MIVSDTNLIVHFWLKSEFNDLAHAVHNSDSVWIAPPLWRSEFRNVLSIYLRKNLIGSKETRITMQSAEEMMSSFEYVSKSIHVLNLIEASSCTSYDCEFVAVAQDLGISLLTFDKKVLKEFPGVAVHPKEYLEN